jgi:hypothetical protein
MLQIGNLRGPLAAAESRTHFGAWCVVSSPLVLGMDLQNESTMAEVWPYVSNSEAINVNQRWAGDPGRVLNLTSAGAGPGAIEVWAKLQPSGAVALLAINTAATASSTEHAVELSEVWPEGAAPEGWCRTQPCAVRDIWAHEDKGVVQGGVLRVAALGPHDSSFMLVTPSP